MLSLIKINWNGVYNAQPLWRLFAEFRIREHHEMSWYLQMRGVEIAELRCVTFYFFKSLRAHSAQEDRVPRSQAGWPPHGRFPQGGQNLCHDAPRFLSVIGVVNR